MLQGLIAGWVFLLFMAALFVDENLRHAIPSAFGVFLAVVVVSMPIWVPMVLATKYKREKTKKQVVKVEVFK
jgi:hypothetical protein